VSVTPPTAQRVTWSAPTRVSIVPSQLRLVQSLRSSQIAHEDAHDVLFAALRWGTRRNETTHAAVRRHSLSHVLSETGEGAANGLLRLHRSGERSEGCAATRRSVPHMPPNCLQGNTAEAAATIGRVGRTPQGHRTCTKSIRLRCETKADMTPCGTSRRITGG
jgi:hypothetical protein